MHSTPSTARRLTLLPVEERRQADRPAIRRYRLGRVIGDLGPAVAGPRAIQAPPTGDRSP